MQFKKSMTTIISERSSIRACTILSGLNGPPIKYKKQPKSLRNIIESLLN
jgi:hypothetical protein